MTWLVFGPYKSLCHTLEASFCLPCLLIFLFKTFSSFFMWAIFRVFIEFVTMLLPFYVLVFWLQGMWDLSFLTRDWTHTPCVRRWSLNCWTTRELPHACFEDYPGCYGDSHVAGPSADRRVGTHPAIVCSSGSLRVVFNQQPRHHLETRWTHRLGNSGVGGAQAVCVLTTWLTASWCILKFKIRCVRGYEVGTTLGTSSFYSSTLLQLALRSLFLLAYWRMDSGEETEGKE